MHSKIVCQTSWLRRVADQNGTYRSGEKRVLRKLKANNSRGRGIFVLGIYNDALMAAAGRYRQAEAAQGRHYTLPALWSAETDDYSLDAAFERARDHAVADTESDQEPRDISLLQAILERGILSYPDDSS